MEPNFTGSIYGRSFTKFPHFVPDRTTNMAPWAILVSDWLIFQKSSPLKPHGQMEPNFTGSICGRSFTKFPHFVPIGLQIWLPWAILVSDWLIFQKSSPLKPHGQMQPNFTGSICGRSFTKFPHFVPIGLQIWLPRAILVSDWLIFQKSSPLKPHGQMQPNFTGSICGRSFTKFPHFVPIGLQIWPPRAILVSDWLIFQKSSNSETTWPNATKLYRKHLCEVLYKVSSFRETTNMAATGNYCL